MLNLTKGFYLEILQVTLSPSFFFNKAEFPGSQIKGGKIPSTNKLAVAFLHFTLSGHVLIVISSFFCCIKNANLKTWCPVKQSHVNFFCIAEIDVRRDANKKPKNSSDYVQEGLSDLPKMTQMEQRENKNSGILTPKQMCFNKHHKTLHP